jgi:hypothetical protein
MIWLDRLRYVCTWIKKVPSKTIVFNPQYSEEYEKALAYWNHAASFKGNKQNFVQIFEHLTTIRHKKNKSLNSIPDLNFSFLSDLPKKTILSQKEYDDFLNNNTSLFSERFLHYDSAHLGSSRHFLLGSVQVKGSGRNMLVSRVDYIHSWGGGQELEGIYSYLISNLLNLQLPSGACPTFKIDRLRTGTAQFLRLNSSLRIAQYSQFLSTQEKDSIRLHLEEIHQTIDPECMLKKIAFQLSMSSMMNIYNYSMISENILLNGAVIDCESLYNGRNLNTYSFCLDLCIEGKRAKSINTKNLSNWDYLESMFGGEKDTRLCNSSVHGPDYILEKLQEVYEDLFKCKLKKLKSEYWDQQNQLNEKLFGINLPKEVVTFLKDFSQIPCEISHRGLKSFNFNWKKNLMVLKRWLDTERPFHVFFISKEKHQIFIRVCFNIKRKPFFDPLLTAFNSKNRLDMFQEAAIFSQELLKKDPIKNASSLNHEINRATFCIPFVMNNVGEIISSKQSMKDAFAVITKTTKLKQIKKLIIKYAYIDETGRYTESSCNAYELPKGINLIIFEIENENDQFKYLTRPLMVKI